MSARATIAVLAVVLSSAALAACGASGGSSSARGVTAQLTASARAEAGGVRLVQVGAFSQPADVTGAPEDPGRVFVVQRTGEVMLILDGHPRARPFLDIAGSVSTQGSDEQGLLGLAFAPDYATSGLFYVDYTTADNDIRVVQYRRSARNPDAADPASGRVVLRIDHHLYANHNGGQLAFGPEGDLYVGVGDGGSEDDPEEKGQNTDTLLGKILRIDPPRRRLHGAGRQSVPRTAGPAGGDLGLRTAQPLALLLRSSDRRSDRRRRRAEPRGGAGLRAGGHGGGRQLRLEHLGGRPPQQAGDGPARGLPGARRQPQRRLLRDHRRLRGPRPIAARLYGRYLFGDYCRAQIESVNLDGGHASGLRATGLSVTATSSFGEDADGHIYIASLDGPVYRLESG